MRYKLYYTIPAWNTAHTYFEVKSKHAAIFKNKNFIPHGRDYAYLPETDLWFNWDIYAWKDLKWDIDLTDASDDCYHLLGNRFQTYLTKKIKNK